MVSIIIPIYNREQIIHETLESIIAQTYINWECIIVDDGSTDSTMEVLSQYTQKDMRIKVFSRPENKVKGANACRNYGLRQCKGDYIQFFDSDDLMHEEHIAKVTAVLETSKDTDYVICKCDTFIKKKGDVKAKTLRPQTKIEDIYRDYILGNVGILTLSVLWRRNIFNKDMIFDEQLQQFQDLDLYSKIIFKNRNFKILNEVLFHVRRNNDSITTINKKLDIKTDSFLTVRERIIKRTPNDKLISLSVIKIVLGVMRYKMAARDYLDSDKCIAFVKHYSNQLSFANRISLYRVIVSYKLFKMIKKGDTKFKSLLKL